MYFAVLINISGEFKNIKYTSIKNLDTKFLKKGNGKITILHKWNDIIIRGFKNGQEHNINKHELPEPIENDIFYGDLIVYKKNKNFKVEDYKQFYNNIFEFENLDDTLLDDELEDLSEDTYDYDDGFIVRDSECDEEFIGED